MFLQIQPVLHIPKGLTTRVTIRESYLGFTAVSFLGAAVIFSDSLKCQRRNGIRWNGCVYSLLMKPATVVSIFVCAFVLVT